MIQGKKDLADLAKAELKLAKDTQKAYEDGLKPYLQAAKAAEDRVKSLETEEDALKISETMNVSLAQAVEMVNIAKLKEKQIDAMGNEDAVAAIQKEIEAREKLVGLIGNKEARDASAKAAKQAATDWQRAADKIQDSITDALMRGFESGKGFAQTLKDTVINMFKTMVLRPVIQGIVGGATGLGAAAAQASGIGGQASMLSNAFSAASTAGTAFTLGSQVLAGTMSAANAAATAFGNTASVVFGDGLSAMLASNGAFGTATGAAATGGSMMASAAAAGPYVAAAVLALNALGVFRSNKTVGSGITGTLGGDDLQAYDLNRRGGSLFSGPSYSLRNERPTEQTQALNNAFLAIRTGTAQMAKDLGLATTQINSFTMSVGDVKVHPDINKLGLVLDGLTDQQKLAKMEEVLQKSGNAMAELVLGAGATAQQLAQLYATVMQERAGLEMQLLQLQGDTVEIRRRERDALHESNRAIYDQIKALEDQTAATANLSSAARRLVKDLGVAVATLVDETILDIDKQIEASTTAADKAREAADAYRTAGRTLTDAARDIMMGVGDVAQNTAREYQRVLGLARGGDVDAMSRLPGAATAMLADQRNQASTRVQAMLQAAQAAVDLAGVAAAADTAATAADYQAKLFDVNTAMLEVLRADLSTGNITTDLLRQHLTALGNIGDLIVGSQNLTVATYKDESGLIRAGLVDNSGRVVAGLDSTTALQLQGMSGQTNNFTNSITSQTATFGALSKEQVAGLEKVENETNTVADITDIVAQATGNNETLSLAILRQLQIPDAGSNYLSETIVTGNEFLAGRLEGVIAAINRQTETQQAEIKRQQELVKAQKEIESFFQQFQSIESQNIQAAKRLAETPQTVQTYLGRGGFFGTGSKRYRTDSNAAYAPALAAAQAASQAAEAAAKQLEAMRQAIRDLGGIPAFATGGLHSGGLRLVGEHGPELEVTGPARYYSAAETSSMMGGGMVDELRGLREEVAMLRAEARATAINTGRTQDIMKRITKNGESMIVSTDGEALEVTAP
jgi:hypothetical protein